MTQIAVLSERRSVNLEAAMVGALLLLCTTVTGQATAPVDLPVLPKRYSAVISANFENHGYTLHFQEFYDEALGVLRQEGFGSSPLLNRWINMTSGIAYEYSEDNPDANCVTYNASATPNAFAKPTSSMFDMVRGTTTYLGLTTVRNIVCDTFQRSMNISVGNGTILIDASYYFSQSNGWYQAPVRVDISGAHTADPSLNVTAENYHHVYDWVMFNVNPDDLEFELGVSSSSVCQPASWNSQNQQFFQNLPRQSTVAPVASTTVMPTIPTQFEATVEIKISQIQLHGDLTDETTFQWYYDKQRHAERVDADSLTTYVTEHDLYLYDGPDMTTGTYYHEERELCTMSSITEGSLLTELRGGVVRSLITNAASFPTPAYAGRVQYRGIPCDSWTINGTIVEDSTTYAYNLQIYFFPEGWQLPQLSGSGLPTRLPVYVRHYGVASTGSTSSSYDSSWDFYRFVPVLASNWATPNSECPAVHAPITPTPTWPVIPTQYYTFVAATQPNRNYSYQYHEYYDSSLNMLRADGRFTQPWITTVINFTSGLVVHFSATNSSEPCTQVQLTSAQLQSFLYAPAASFINAINTPPPGFVIQGSPVQYLGLATTPRGILSNHFQQQAVAMNNTFVADFYFELESDPKIVDPLRMDVTYINPDGVQDRTVRDFVAWVNEPIVVSEFATPPLSQCQVLATDTLPARPAPVFLSPAPSPSSPPPQPIIPGNFSILFEVSQGSYGGFAPTTTGGEWEYSSAQKLHRYEPLDAVVTMDAVTGLVSSYDDSGSCLVSTFPNGSSPASLQPVGANPVPTQPYHPFPVAALRAGTFFDLFTSPLPFYMNSVYRGRSVTNRGVVGDVWRREITVNNRYGNPNDAANPVATYDVEQEVWAYVPGWVVLGRPLTGYPFRVVEVTTALNSVGAELWVTTDVYDLFDFQPNPPPIDLTDLGTCIAATPKPEFTIAYIKYMVLEDATTWAWLILGYLFLLGAIIGCCVYNKIKFGHALGVDAR